MYGTEIITTEERDRRHYPGHDEVVALVTVRVDEGLVGPHDAPITARRAAETAVEGVPVSTQIEKGPYKLFDGDGYFDVAVTSTIEY